MQRHFARKGDTTTANGVILDGEDAYTHHGVPVAFHGAKVSCPACNTTGVIVTVPPLHPCTIRGKQIALHGDLCVCGCSQPPRLLASQTSGQMSFKESASEAVSREGNGADSLQGSSIAGLATAVKASPGDDYERMKQAAYGDSRFWTAQVGPPAPGTANSSSASALSGSSWVSRFPTSTSTSDLVPPFREHVEAFISSLQTGGASVSINATLRPPERAYLMHYSYEISTETDPSSVPAMDGVGIDWIHRNSNGSPDLATSQLAGQQMVNGYGITYPPALSSRHTEGRAVDMTITNHIGKTFTNAEGAAVTVASQSDLEALGATYEVIKLCSDPPHWSDDGR